MKRKALSALLVLLLTLLIPVSASADVIYPAPESFTVGVEVNHLLATLDPGGTVWTDEALLPDGLRLEAVATEDGVNVYLRGFPTTPGTYDLLFRYNDTVSLCTVTILPGEAPEPVPVTLSVETLPLVTEYTEGELLDPEGLSLKLEMSDSTHYLVTEGYTLRPTLLEESGVQSIDVSYEGLSCSFNVNVSPVPEQIKSISLERLPDKQVYRVGEELDPAGLMIRVFTESGSRDEFSHLLCTPTLLTQPGRQEITVYYMEESCSFYVTVLPSPASLKPSASPAPSAAPRPAPRPPLEPGVTLEEDVIPEPEASPEPSPEPEASPEPSPEPSETPAPTPEATEAPEPEATETPDPEPSEAPGPEPSEEPGPEPSEEPGPEPSESPAVPAEERFSPPSQDGQARQGTKILAVILIAALGALAVVGIYVFYFNRSTREYFTDFFKDLFRKKR